MRLAPSKRFLTALPFACFALPAAAQTTDAECAVYRGQALVEQNACRRIVERSGAALTDDGAGGPWIIRYRWASGGSTVTENVEEYFRINGQPGETTWIDDGDWSLCVKNLTSGNTFCAKF
ncbi:hypothetical protein [Oricola sp.]|uniref:hypothetical protein n=1 Tax=Oricola sp. TaxID=1979950 RepID=UPI003BAD8F05